MQLGKYTACAPCRRVCGRRPAGGERRRSKAARRSYGSARSWPGRRRRPAPSDPRADRAECRSPTSGNARPPSGRGAGRFRCGRACGSALSDSRHRSTRGRRWRIGHRPRRSRSVEVSSRSASSAPSVPAVRRRAISRRSTMRWRGVVVSSRLGHFDRSSRTRCTCRLPLPPREAISGRQMRLGVGIDDDARIEQTLGIA